MWGGSVAELHTELRAKIWPLDQTKYAPRLAFVGTVPRQVT